jgi:hypothetical protein
MVSSRAGLPAEVEVLGRTGAIYLQSAKKIGKFAGGVGVVLTVLDAAQKGKWQNHHTADVAIGVGSATFLTGPAGWAIGTGYFLLDYGVKKYSGKSITEHIFD